MIQPPPQWLTWFMGISYLWICSYHGAIQQDYFMYGFGVVGLSLVLLSVVTEIIPRLFKDLN